MSRSDVAVAEKYDEVATESQPGPSPEEAKERDHTGSGAPWDLVLKTVGGIAAGVGVLGFVTLAGGVILYERLSGAHLPAEDAVAVVPRTNLLTIGASQLVPLACIVGLVVLALWIGVALKKDDNPKAAQDGVPVPVSPSLTEAARQRKGTACGWWPARPRAVASSISLRLLTIFPAS
jgi:hypothetical protein